LYFPVLAIFLAMPPEEVVNPAPSEEITSFLAKDGLYYRSYMEQRAANIRHNEAKLKAVGLDESFRSHMRRNNGTTPLKRRKIMSPQSDEASRKSSRIRRQPPPLALELPPSPRAGQKIRAQRIPRRKGAEEGAVHALTEEDRQQLQRYATADWLPEMERYLKDVEHVSYPNQRSVLRQVEKLVSGDGITYARWNDDSSSAEIYFGRGRNVSLTDDFDQLYDEACAFEEAHGRDLGNGAYCRSE
jgi:hypothetical protein